VTTNAEWKRKSAAAREAITHRADEAIQETLDDLRAQRWAEKQYGLPAARWGDEPSSPTPGRTPERDRVTAVAEYSALRPAVRKVWNDLQASKGEDRDRILIKLASTLRWSREAWGDERRMKCLLELWKLRPTPEALAKAIFVACHDYSERHARQLRP